MTDLQIADAAFAALLTGAFGWGTGYAAVVYLGFDVWLVGPILGFLILAFAIATLTDDSEDDSPPGPEDLE